MVHAVGQSSEIMSEFNVEVSTGHTTYSAIRSAAFAFRRGSSDEYKTNRCGARS